MENAYAQALWNLVAGGSEPAKAVRSLRETLARQGRAALLPKIGRAFARIAERERARRGLTLYVAREQDGRTAAAEATKDIEAMNVAATEFDVRVDDSLIGGWRLEGAGVLLDRSFRKQLLEMYNRAVR